MSDHNEHNRPPAPQTRSERRERVKEYCRILQKVTHDLRSSITERDLRKILSAPIGKRDSNTNAVISQDILWEYLPREQDGLTIDPFTASFILQDVTDQALRQKLREIPGYAWTSVGRNLDGPTDMLCVFRGKDSRFPTIYKIFPS